jgi:hypothetical protein
MLLLLPQQNIREILLVLFSCRHGLSIESGRERESETALAAA